jgi:hypothetical protein
MVLDHGANLNPRASPTPLREGNVSTRVDLFGSIMTAHVNSFSHHACDLVLGLEGACSMPRGISLPENTTKWVAIIPRTEKVEIKPPYMCPGCSNHTYNNNMINRHHVR